METVVITERDQKTRQYEKDAHPNVELAQEALNDMREATVENVSKMRDKHQVGSQCAYPCQGWDIIL